MPRFVILRHELPKRPSHWDVMLECDDSLLTWSITRIPVDGEPVVARRLPDHRTVYLDYEGPVSGDRGHVHRWDSGTYQMLPSGDFEFAIRIEGDRLNGMLHLQRVDASDCWIVTLESSV